MLRKWIARPAIEETQGTRIGIVRWVTDYPKKPEEFGKIQIECQCSADVDIYRLSFQDLRKFLVEK